MKLTYLTPILLFTFVLAGCTTSSSNTVKRYHHTVALTNTVDDHHKRINTTDCKDSDDWYLDGYRVGKSFSTQKNAQFQQRLAYCNFTSQRLPAQYKTNWENGFAVGNNQLPNTRKTKKKHS